VATPAAAQRTTAPRGLTRADVVETGVGIIARHGLSALTLQGAADELGVRRSTLYHHLPGGLRELRSAVVDRIAVLLTEESGALAPEATIDAWLDGTTARLAQASLRFPGLLEYLVTDGHDERMVLDDSERLVGLIAAAGDLEAIAPEAWVAVHAYIAGWVCARRPTAGAARTGGFGGLATALDAVEGLDAERILQDGLRALLDGLARPGARGRGPGTGPV
jgi:AcrR family transcriptional regulator